MMQIDETFEVKIPLWKTIIREGMKHSQEAFYDMIWEMSLNAFDIPREVQVLIDAKGKSFISVGNPSFVSFDQQDDELYGKSDKMSFPLKEWIHTHPFGKAYFSGTDLRTIAIYRNHMKIATVLGDGERMVLKFGVGPSGQDYQEYVQHTFVGDEEE